jgi:hypothetical protein
VLLTEHCPSACTTYVPTYAHTHHTHTHTHTCRVRKASLHCLSISVKGSSACTSGSLDSLNISATVCLSVVHTSAYVSIRQHTSNSRFLRLSAGLWYIRQHTSDYVRICQRPSAYVRLNISSTVNWSVVHTSASVSLRQHMSAYVSIRQTEQICDCRQSLCLCRFLMDAALSC